jgi:hypothetical protein
MLARTPWRRFARRVRSEVVRSLCSQLDSPRDLPLAAHEGHRRIWLGQRQPALAQLSTRGRLVVVNGSGHRIAFERPDAVVDAVRRVVNEARR